MQTFWIKHFLFLLNTILLTPDFEKTYMRA